MNFSLLALLSVSLLCISTPSIYGAGRNSAAAQNTVNNINNATANQALLNQNALLQSIQDTKTLIANRAALVTLYNIKKNSIPAADKTTHADAIRYITSLATQTPQLTTAETQANALSATATQAQMQAIKSVVTRVNTAVTASPTLETQLTNLNTFLSGLPTPPATSAGATGGSTGGTTLPTPPATNGGRRGA